MSFAIALLLHLLGACIWTGGHLVLALAVLPGALRARDPEVVRRFEAGYERIGIPALAVQVVTGVMLAHTWVPDWSRLLAPQTRLEAHVAAKFVLLGLTALLAMHARLRILPRLSAETLGALAWHIGAVTVLSVLFVLVGGGIRLGGV